VNGRLVAQVTTSSPRLDVGDRFVVLGNSIAVAESRIYFAAR
jgi:hypothetical protein